MSNKSRHLSVTGFTRDKSKQNLAQQEGYKIMEYTVLNFREIVNDLKQLKK